MAGGVISLGQDGYYYRPSDTFFSMFGRTIAGLRMLTGQPVLLAETSVGPQVGGVASARQDGQAGGGDGALEHQRGFLFWSWTLAGPFGHLRGALGRERGRGQHGLGAEGLGALGLGAVAGPGDHRRDDPLRVPEHRCSAVKPPIDRPTTCARPMPRPSSTAIASATARSCEYASGSVGTSDGERTELTELEMVRSKPLPSRRSRSPTWACRPPAGPWPVRTAGPDAGTCGSGPWTRSAWDTTPEEFFPVPAHGR